MNKMQDIIEDYYSPLLKNNGFSPEPENYEYGDMGLCWRLSPEVGEGTYWTYGQKDLFDIKIHNFTFHKDSMLEFSLPECLSITRYDSISGEEFSPYHRLSAGCIKTFIGGENPYKVLIHKNILICSTGIEIMPSYYKNYLKNQYPDEYTSPQEAFRHIGQTTDFHQMSKLLTEIKNYRGNGIAAKLFYEGKVAEAISLVIERQKRDKNKDIYSHNLSSQDVKQIQYVTAYLNGHYAFDVPMERLTQIACMGTTKLKTVFKQVNDCTITEYVRQRRMEQAEYLLAETDFSIGQISQMIGYSNASRFAELFRKSTGLLPGQYRKMAKRTPS